jgi:hypothetical protein
METSVRNSWRMILLAGSAVALPAAAHAGDDTQFWQTVNVGVDLGHGFKVTNETVLRTSDHKGFYEVEDNLLLGYKLNKTVTVWAGYTHDPNYSHGDFTVMERRFRQQVTFDNFAKLGDVKFSARMRGEERWREGVAGTGWRLRPYVKATMPIVGKTALVVSNESFFNLNKMAFQKQSGLDRMRTFIGVNTPLVKHVAIEVGYLNQHGFVRSGPDTDDHVLSASLNASF